MPSLRAGTPYGTYVQDPAAFASPVKAFSFPQTATLRRALTVGRLGWISQPLVPSQCRPATPPAVEDGPQDLSCLAGQTHPANSDDGSIFTPGPIVEEMATRLIKWPLAPGGFAF